MPFPRWLIGVLINVIGSLMINVGYILELIIILPADPWLRWFSYLFTQNLYICSLFIYFLCIIHGMCMSRFLEHTCTIYTEPIWLSCTTMPLSARPQRLLTVTISLIPLEGFCLKPPSIIHEIFLVNRAMVLTLLRVTAVTCTGSPV